ncbi:hypothetical protein RHO14_08950 [Orbus wheelerorum]|uniref:hypothetical protein n=1 Tax=Orbus wheelerorum TaxID=3074111 RepID=UPI00370D757A
MEIWALIFSGLSAIASIGLLICTIIGFKFIGKQTSIAKNKDILFSLQKDLNQYLGQFYSTHARLQYECNKIIHNYPLLSEISDDDFKKYNPLFTVLHTHLEDYRKRNCQEKKFIFFNYNWWLSDFKKNLYKIMNSEQHVRVDNIHKRLIEAVFEFYKNQNFDEQYNEIKEREELIIILDKISNDFTGDLNYINDELDTFLEKLAKNKNIL